MEDKLEKHLEERRKEIEQLTDLSDEDTEIALSMYRLGYTQGVQDAKEESK